MSIGGVVARAEIMNCLDANSISTFGGSPVTMAAALANLTYLLDARPPGQRPPGRRSCSTGCGSGASSPIVGEVRGRGLMIGVELVEPGTGDPGEPAPEPAAPCSRRPASAGC